MAFTTQDFPAEYRTYSRRDYEKKKEHIAESSAQIIDCLKFNNDSNYLIHTNAIKLDEYVNFSNYGKLYIISEKEPTKHYISENLKKIESVILKEYNSVDISVEFLNTAIKLKNDLALLNFKDIVVEFLQNDVIQFTLSFGEKRLLMIDKFLYPFDNDFTEGQVIYSYFINRKLIGSNVVEISDFVKKFQDYITM